MVNGWPYTIYGDILGTPAVGDIDNDGKKEIVVTSSYLDHEEMESPGSYIYVWHHDGSLVNGWPIKIANGISFSYSPVLADVNKDGFYEIFVGGERKMLGLSYDGKNLLGWPIKLDYSQISYSSAIGDIDNDGKIEIVFGSGEGFYVIKGDGQFVKYFNINEIPNTSPIISDLNKDGILEIIGGGYNSPVYAWNFNGDLFKSFPKLVGEMGVGPVICDIDNDGKIELIVASRDKGVYVWNLDALYNPDLIPWPMFQHDPQHTGCYNCDKPQTPITKSCTIEGPSEITINPSSTFDIAPIVKCYNSEKVQISCPQDLNPQTRYSVISSDNAVVKIVDRSVVFPAPYKYKLKIKGLSAGSATISTNANWQQAGYSSCSKIIVVK